MPRHSTIAGRSVALLLGLSGALAPPAAAQTPPASPPPVRIAEEVIVTASAWPADANRIGRSVTVLTGEDLRRLGIGVVADALRLVPGVDVRARGPRDVQTDFSIRGATFGQNLVLIDGFRLNDSQSGHHNGDIPAPVLGLDRIEVVHGPGSAVHGADALGGTINFITRRDRHHSIDLAAGQHGLVSGQAGLSRLFGRGSWTATGWGSRSGGFTFDREFALGGGGFQVVPRAGLTFDLRHQRKAFGANGFYGASPSKEWTDQTLATATWERVAGRWATSVRGLYRNHGDHFRWDIARPGFAENRHRTDAAEGVMVLRRDLGRERILTVGGGGGGDWIDSSNLGDREYGHGQAFAEVQWPIAAQAVMTGGLRADAYSNFGSSLNPSIAMSVRASRSVRIRASVARGFRVPTFTELYYTDPANLGSPDLVAEHGWSLDGGADWSASGWTVSLSPFVRWDANVIDWLRPTSTDRWRSTNVRDVRTTGVEIGVTRRWRSAFFRGGVTALDVDAPALTQLSKYVLEYARQSITGSITAPVAGRLRLAINADHRRRFGGRSDTLVGARLSLAFAHGDVYVDGTNLLNENYYEVAGVAMPGRWLSVGFTLR